MGQAQPGAVPVPLCPGLGRAQRGAGGGRALTGRLGRASPPRRARQSGGKVRHKRQALQDMARPLKQWLYKHRDNPYPTKTEKILLALGSQMTLVQVRLRTHAPAPLPCHGLRSSPCLRLLRGGLGHPAG